jgi:hypothetical protein
MKTILTGLMIALLQVLGAATAIAQQEPSPDLREMAERYTVAKNEKNFTGWKGVVFYCHSPTSDNKHLKEICEKSYTNVSFLAATAKVKLAKARDAAEAAYGAIVGDLLTLELELFSTESGSLTAVHADLRASVSYSNAVEDVVSMAPKRSSARSKPRSGDLILWERTATGASSGSAQELVVPVSQGIEEHLKQFFADYLNAQK